MKSSKMSQFSDLLQNIFEGVVCLSYRDYFVNNYNEKAKTHKTTKK